MIKSYNQILREVGDAVDYVRAEGGYAPWDAVAQQTEVGEWLVDTPDDEVLENWYDDELLIAPPNMVRASSVEEFAMVYKALGYIHGGLDQSSIDKDIRHELAHKAAADVIGFRQSVFTLTVTESSIRRRPILGTITGTRFRWRPSAQQAGPLRAVTKLTVASVLAAPRELSKGDSARINAMGYENRDDVARRIVTATNPRLSSLPLPEDLNKEMFRG